MKNNRHTNTLCLRVLSGLHEGAEVSLGNHSLLVLGSAADCDIVIRDAGVAPRHLALTVQNGEVQVRSLEAPVVHAGSTYAAGSSINLAPYERLEFSAVSVAVGSSGASEWAALSTPAPAAEPAADTTGAPAAAQSADSGTEAEAISGSAWQRFTSSRAAAVATLGLIALSVSVTTWWAVAVLLPSPGSQAAVAGYLRELGFGNLNVSEQDKVVTVDGVVYNEAQRALLARKLSERGVAANLKIASGQQLVEEVKNVFRINGLNVEAHYAEDGAIEIVPPIEKQDQAARVIKLAQQDLGGNAKLRWQIALRPETPADGHSALRQAEQQIAEVPPANDGGEAKRVVALVEGPGAHVVTKDGTRYFVGSLLPQGYRVVNIDNGVLTVERDGGTKMTISF